MLQIGCGSLSCENRCTDKKNKKRPCRRPIGPRALGAPCLCRTACCGRRGDARRKEENAVPPVRRRRGGKEAGGRRPAPRPVQSCPVRDGKL